MEIIKPLAFFLTVLAAFCGVGLVVAGGGDGRWEHRGVLRIARPPDLVFPWVIEPARREQWVEGLISSRASGPLKKGARVKEVLEIDGQRRERVVEITEYVDGEVVTLRTTEEGIELEIRYEVHVHQSGGRSRVDYTCKAHYPGLWSRIVEPFLSWKTLARIKSDLDRLERKAEESYD